MFCPTYEEEIKTGEATLKKPDREDYMRVFRWHGLQDTDFYGMEKQPDAVYTSFEQISRLSRHHSSFNESLPAEFSGPLRKYCSGDSDQISWFSDIANRTLFISDFIDYLKVIEKHIS